MTKVSLPRCLWAALALVPATAIAADQPLFVPALEQDFADPFIIRHGDEFIGYATNRGINLPMASSKNLVDWALIMDPANPKKPLDGLPKLGSWAREGLTWAPEVIQVGNRWVLYYTARHKKLDKQCIGAASADDPRGPFRDASADALVCQPELGGTIDANPFRDADGKLYLYYKNDGNALKKPTEIWGQRLSADGINVEGAPVSLGLRNDAAWENHVIEAPTMVRRPGGGYVMFYSAHHYGWEKDQRLSAYAMGYATCTSPMGPCNDSPDNPILYSFNSRKVGCISGPGHQSVFEAAGRTFISFHAWSATNGCRKAADRRYLYIAPLSWKDRKPVIGPSVRRRAD
jgi:beta-xylosidase